MPFREYRAIVMSIQIYFWCGHSAVLLSGMDYWGMSGNAWLGWFHHLQMLQELMWNWCTCFKTSLMSWLAASCIGNREPTGISVFLWCVIDTNQELCRLPQDKLKSLQEVVQAMHYTRCSGRCRYQQDHWLWPLTSSYLAAVLLKEVLVTPLYSISPWKLTMLFPLPLF